MERSKYLFIRILEACNADCFMCSFSLSKDRYRFSQEDFKGLLKEAIRANVGYIRFTGGEPLMHKDIQRFVEMTHQAGLKTSIITNGSLLPKKVEALGEAGLSQIIVSIDALELTHNKIRGIPKLYDNCLEGLKRAHKLGIKTRVNTVVGPDNYQDIP